MNLLKCLFTICIIFFCFFVEVYACGPVPTLWEMTTAENLNKISITLMGSDQSVIFTPLQLLRDYHYPVGGFDPKGYLRGILAFPSHPPMPQRGEFETKEDFEKRSLTNRNLFKTVQAINAKFAVFMPSFLITFSKYCIDHQKYIIYVRRMSHYTE